MCCSLCSTTHCRQQYPGGWHKTCVKQFVQGWRSEHGGAVYPTPDAEDGWLCPICLGAVEDFKQCAKATAVRCRPMVPAITAHMPPHGGKVKMPPCGGKA